MTEEEIRASLRVWEDSNESLVQEGEDLDFKRQKFFEDPFASKKSEQDDDLLAFFNPIRDLKKET
eukprot:CAMPEP_0202979764 /NCGR_PEP_ID=MMETSP1396-20130829/85835_1 /ASSEMBLY_ACC=CAM_ASM_000872 /TAXON_ID= /ORGANISM="Pseudokeronopsis sp., Strain Brazil" /LENGTH=64 /DNA_ID=CAMNT_0049719357 /DNA_START=800 /DNA_END=994 /DNA_ORIENTATION=-